MSGQMKISAFFPQLQKRGKGELSDDDRASNKINDTPVTSTPSKKRELIDDDGGGDELHKVPKVALSPEQKQRMEENRLLALAKLQNKSPSPSSQILVNVGQSWYQALEPEFSKSYFSKLSKFVVAERQKNTVYPLPEQVFTWTQMSDINQIKVVMLGQDPYHGPKQAHGLCFSVPKGTAPPPSLVNMYKELQSDIEGFQHPNHGCLVGWSRQGVLLLNAVLTVRAHNANSHKDQGWEKLTDAVISWINKNLQGVVFLLWGAYAQKKGAFIDKSRHHVLTAPHPSPLSAYKGFLGCKHFSQTNTILKDQGKEPIDWTYLPDE